METNAQEGTYDFDLQELSVEDAPDNWKIKKVTAMQEIQNEGKQMLVAEYEGFATPICDYLNHLKLPPEMGVELLEELSEMGTYNCTSDETTQRVEAIEGLDFLWPQLTGKLRVEK